MGRRGPKKVDHTTSVFSHAGTKDHQAMCTCGEAGWLRSTVEEAESDARFHERSKPNQWPSPKRDGRSSIK